MGRVAERAEVRIMRRFDPHRSSSPHQPVKLLHRADYVVQMLDHVDRRHPVERSIREWVGETIQIGQDVGLAGGIAVKSDRTGLLPYPAADVEYPHPPALAMHSSSVCTAKSH